MDAQAINKNIGARLKLRRTQLGLSQQDIGRVCGVTFQQIQKYEKGVNAMNAARMYQFAQALHVSIIFFYEEIGSEMTGSASDRESLEAMKGFNEIASDMVRKRLSDLMRAIATET